MTGRRPSAGVESDRSSNRSRDATASEPTGILPRALGRLRRDPLLVLPFAIAGFVLAVLDHLHRHDPLPAPEGAWLGDRTFSVEFVGYPIGATRTLLPLESLFGLEVPFLLWGLGLYVLGLGAVSVAGVVTIQRATTADTAHSLRAIGPFFGYVLGLDLLQRTLGSIDILQGMGLFLGIPIVALYLYVMVRLFVAPGLLADGWSIPAAVHGSHQVTTGSGWSIVAVVLLLGLLAWLLASVPAIGAFPSTIVVAPIHAAAIVAVLEIEVPRRFGA